jgi:hypothetical protein
MREWIYLLNTGAVGWGVVVLSACLNTVDYVGSVIDGGADVGAADVASPLDAIWAANAAKGEANAVDAGNDVSDEAAAVDDCTAKAAAYADALALAQQCDPAAAMPCLVYQDCSYYGVNPDAVDELTTLRDDSSAACGDFAGSCPNSAHPPTYVCQSSGAVNVCMQVAQARQITTH